MWPKIRKQVAGDWEKMADLVLGCEETFGQLESEITRFIENQLPET